MFEICFFELSWRYCAAMVQLLHALRQEGLAGHCRLLMQVNVTKAFPLYVLICSA
jgi:hypothetical protein